MKPACRKPLVTSRQYSWPWAMSGPLSAPRETTPPPPRWATPEPDASSATNAITLIAIST